MWVYDDREFRYDSVRLADRNQAYYRVFHMPKRNLTRSIVDATCLIPDLEPGRYAVEVWDTYRGEIIDITELDATDEGLRVSLPEFRKDIALKVKQILY